MKPALLLLALAGLAPLSRGWCGAPSYAPPAISAKKISRALAALEATDGVEMDLKLTKNESDALVESLRNLLKKEGTAVHGSVIADAPFLQIHAAAHE